MEQVPKGWPGTKGVAGFVLLASRNSILEELNSMHKSFLTPLFLISLLISACSAGTPSPPTQQVLPVYSSPAAEPWLSELYDCAAGQDNVVLSRMDDANAAGIRLQIGEPEFLSSFAYQIDEEEILIVTNRVSPIQNLTLEQAQTLFMGFGDPSVQVWVYA